jgi:two-component system, cell cycle sensor histidine kinase and response regulator CckA
MAFLWLALAKGCNASVRSIGVDLNHKAADLPLRTIKPFGGARKWDREGGHYHLYYSLMVLSTALGASFAMGSKRIPKCGLKFAGTALKTGGCAQLRQHSGCGRKDERRGESVVVQSITLAGASALRERDDRLESLKSLAGHVAHDFNNFLVPILGYLALIQEEAAPGSAIAQYAGKIESSARRTELFLEELLLATRPARVFSPAQFDLHEVVKSCLEIWAPQFCEENGIAVTVHLDKCQVEGDGRMFTGAVGELLSNARFALAGGGCLEVFLDRCNLDESAARSLGMAAGASARLVIADNGFGMSAEICRRACEPLFTTRPRNMADGLGLTMVQSVARLHGGQLLIESEPDKGTRATVWLPLVLPPRSGAEGEWVEKALEAARKKRRKVLLVERDLVCSEVFQSELQHLDLDVFATGDLIEAGEYALKHKELALAVVSPGSEGGWVEEIQKRAKTVPLLIIATGKNKNAVTHGGPQRLEILEKPFRLEKLRKMAASLIR